MMEIDEKAMAYCLVEASLRQGNQPAYLSELPSDEA